MMYDDDSHAVVCRGVHFGDRVGLGPEIKKPDRVSGDFGGPDIRYIVGRGFQVFGFRGFSARVFGAPDFDIFCEQLQKQTILRHLELELGLSPFIRVIAYI